jgi:hypothetical protein
MIGFLLQPGLKCFQWDGYTPVPGCSGDGSIYKDYCYRPPTQLNVVDNIGLEPHQLGLCEGDCESDKDCQHGLVCYQTSIYVKGVPGCERESVNASTDYCTYPWLIDQLVLVGNNDLMTKLGVCEGSCDDDK